MSGYDILQYIQDWGLMLVAFLTRGFILFGPTSRLEQDFQLVGDNLLEAKAFANAHACKGALLSFIPVTYVSILVKANSLCAGSAQLVTLVIATVGAIVMVWLLAKIPHAWYRGSRVSYVILGVTLILDIVTQAFLIDRLAAPLCVTRSPPGGP